MNLRGAVTVLMIVLAVAPCSAAADREWRNRASTTREIFTGGDAAEEIRFGREVAARILGRLPRYEDEKLQQYVTLVGRALAANANRPELDFRFAVVESPEINAYSAPGGYVFVTTSALRAMKNEAELAGALGHEIGHVVERHIVRDLNLRQSENSAAATLAVAVGGAGETAGIAFSQAVDKALEIILRDGYRMEDEMQADLDAVYFTAVSGFDPRGLVTLLERVSAVKTDVGKSYPLYDTRLAHLQQAITEEGAGSLPTFSSTDRFAAAVAGLAAGGRE